MDSDETRSRILDDHARLRGMLDGLERLIERFDAGGREVGQELRGRGVELFEVFAAHIQLEDAALVPALRGLGESGKARAERLAHEHEEQRELIRYLLDRLGDDHRPSLVVARELQAFVQYVRQDMAHEEEAILGEDLL
jgi:hemerythrin-like domain-containing protein